MTFPSHALRAPGCRARSVAVAYRDRRALRPRLDLMFQLLRVGLCCSLFVAATPAADEGANSTFNAELSARANAQAQIEEDLRVEVLSEGTSSRRLKRSAVDELPLDRLTPTGRQLAEKVIDEVSLHRRLPVVRCETDPRVLRFFLTHPDVAVGIWRAMQVSNMQLELIGPNRYRTDGGDGSAGIITVLLADPQQYLIHCEGSFQTPVLAKAIHASALMWLKTMPQRDPQGREFAECTADVFIAFPSNTVETAARIVSPVSNKIADRNFHEVAMFIRMMHLAMTRQPGWVEQTAGQLQGVEPERGRALVDTTATVYVDGQKRLASAPANSLTPEALRLPIRREPEAATATSGASEPAPQRVTAVPATSVNQ